MPSHTPNMVPPPWAVREAGGLFVIVIEEKGGAYSVAITTCGCGSCKVNADLIVRAVNSHEGLLAALKELLGCAWPGQVGGRTDLAMKAAKAAIAAAETK